MFLSVTIITGCLTTFVRLVYSDYCSEAYSCTKTCYRQVRYYTSCGLFGWDRCTRSRDEAYTCTDTCYRQTCCFGYTGDNCNTPLCFGSPSCSNGGRCVSPNVCSCTTGYALPQCADINECNTGTHDCQQDCTNTDGSFTCSCMVGFSLNTDLRTCFDINECMSNNAGCAQVCTNTNGSFICTCHNGYSLRSDKTTCQDIDECAQGISGCQTTCTNTIGSFQCSCSTGYRLALDSKNCEDVDECTDGSSNCSHLCNNTVGSYLCSCPTGYALHGVLCRDVDECSDGISNCTDICTNTAGSFSCSCAKGYALAMDGTTCQDIDECSLSIHGCSDFCQNTIGSYICHCLAGFALANDNTTCIDIDDCKNVDCFNNGTCIDSQQKYICACSQGFTGQNCQSDIDECRILNGGCRDICINTNGSYFCTCNEQSTIGTDELSCTGGNNSLGTVFEKYQIPRQQLPKPCFPIVLTKCTDGNEIEIHLTSTSEWYTLNSEHVLFTMGIVFVQVNSLSLPISLKGVEVEMKDQSFKINIGVNYNATSGSAMDINKTEECQSFNLVEHDIFDIIQANSFLGTYLIALISSLPNWIGFDKSSDNILSVQNLRSELIYGRDMDSVLWCKGAPVISNHLYSVFLFDSGFVMTIYASKIRVPQALLSKKFCLIVDICQNNGGSVFLMFPDESRDILLSIEIFKRLYEHQNIFIKPRGIGVSSVNGINVHYFAEETTLWNGDAMFKYPIFNRSDFWIGGDLIKNETLFTINGAADIFFNVPSVQTMITSLFSDEWNGYIKIKMAVSPILKFSLFGKMHAVTFDIATLNVNGYVSIGGSNREWCGEVSNPPGVFLTAMLTVNPFIGVPILENWALDFPNTLYAFVTTDPKSDALENVTINLANDILELDLVLERVSRLINDTLHNFKITFSVTTHSIINKISEILINIKGFINIVFRDISKLSFGKIKDLINSLWREIEQIKEYINQFLDQVEFIADKALQMFADMISDEIDRIQQSINTVITKVTDKITSSVTHYTGFGLKYTTSLTIFGFNFIAIDIEVVYSNGNLFQCSRFKKVNLLLNGERALRFIGRVSRKLRFGYFLSYEPGFAFGGALATQSNNAIMQLEVFVKMLGITATTDVFISNQGLYTYMEVNVWNIFLAQVDVSAEANKQWDQLTYRVEGRFVAKARRKRQLQTVSSSFQSSYLDALIKAVELISDEVGKRINQAQNALTLAQNGFTKAQQWLEEKKSTVQNANAAFDDAVQTLENAKMKLENAKKPYEDALQKLNDAQRNVDNLCRIRSCDGICVPGIRCSICHLSGWISIPYPCCDWTSCMFKIPNVLCEIANAACAILRGIAFAALEFAKIFVRIPIIAFDTAKAAVSVAQFVVDKSRVVLKVAEGILDFAIAGLEFAKITLEAAKLALETVKGVIGLAVKLFEFVINYGVKNVIDVRNCGFSIELSTHDLAVFDVFCDINAFQLGWQKVKITINFKNILQSLWQAARATISAIIDAFGNILTGRKRRDIEFDISSKMHYFIRKMRNAPNIHAFNSTTEFDETIQYSDYANYDYESRVQLFKQKCESFTKVQNFMNDAFQTLWEVANTSIQYINEVTNLKANLTALNSETVMENITIENLEISIEYAKTDYNVTENDLENVLNKTKEAVATEQLFLEINKAAQDSLKYIEAETASIESFDFLNAWLTAMGNITNEYFEDTECVDFRDCILYSVSTLYQLYEYEHEPNIREIKLLLLNLEQILINILYNSTSSIERSFSSIDDSYAQIRKLISSNYFCSEAPVFYSALANRSAYIGTHVTFTCFAYADPEPEYWWFKQGQLIEGERDSKLTILNITMDSADVYTCMAGNLVANLTSNDAYLSIHNETERYFRRKFVLILNVTLPDRSYLGNQLTYARVADKITIMINSFYDNYIRGSFEVELIQLKPGSIIAEYYILFDDTNARLTGDVVYATLLLSGGQYVEYSNQTVWIYLDSYRNVSNACELYALIVGRCPEGSSCVFEDSRPICRQLTNDGIEGKQIIAAVSGGVAAGVICITVSVIACVLRKRRQKHASSTTQSSKRAYNQKTYGLDDTNTVYMDSVVREENAYVALKMENPAFNTDEAIDLQIYHNSVCNRDSERSRTTY